MARRCACLLLCAVSLYGVLHPHALLCADELVEDEKKVRSDWIVELRNLDEYRMAGPNELLHLAKPDPADRKEGEILRDERLQWNRRSLRARKGCRRTSGFSKNAVRCIARLLRMVDVKQPANHFVDARHHVRDFCRRFCDLPADEQIEKQHLMLVLNLAGFGERKDFERSPAQLLDRIRNVRQVMVHTRQSAAIPLLANRNERLAHAREAVNAPNGEPERLPDKAYCTCFKGSKDRCYCDYCDAPRRKAAREAACELEARFFMATNTEMAMEPESPAHFANLIEHAVHVADDDTRRIQAKYLARLSVSTALPSCASCGVRDPKCCYERKRVTDLPPCFRINPRVATSDNRLTGAAWHRVRSKLRSSEVMTIDGPKEMDLSPILSFYQSKTNGAYYHLHPELVNDKEVVLLCDRCLDKACFCNLAWLGSKLAMAQARPVLAVAWLRTRLDDVAGVRQAKRTRSSQVLSG